MFGRKKKKEHNVFISKNPHTSAADLIHRARCRLLYTSNWYGQFAIGMKWKPITSSVKMDTECPTMGVCMQNGEVVCYYNELFVKSQTVEELCGAIQHEIEHVLKLHPVRRSTERKPETWNIAADMVVNGRKHAPRIGYKDHRSENKPLILPLNGELNYIPNGWPINETTEYYYDRLVEEEQGKGKDKPTYKPLDSHAVWAKSDTDPHVARELIKSAAHKASSAAQGLVPAHIKEWIAELDKPVVKWQHILKQYIARHIGNARWTFSRVNRRYDTWGIPGRTYHAASSINVIVDTSGSVSLEEEQKFFTEIERICTRSEVWVLLWDCAFQGYQKYRKGDWKKYPISGRGGTDMAKPIEWLKKNNRVKQCQVIFTDGICNWAAPQPFPVITVINNNKAKGPDWGLVIRLTDE